ncbi:10662_t:CDS:2, partial [Cetraspora pellucida]
MKRSACKIFFLEVYVSEEEEEEDVNNLQKEFEKKINAYVDSDVDTDVDAYMNMDSDAYTEVDAYMEVDADMDVDADMNMDADTDAYTDLRVDANANTDTDGESIDNNEIFNDTFVDWDLAIEHIEKHDIENGFEVVKCRLQKNKRNEVVHRTFECKKSRKYYSQKKADMEDNHERETKNIQSIGSKFQRLSSEMLEEVKFFTNIGCGTGPIICGLQECFPDATDAAVTYEKLMQLQREEHGWFIDA